MKDVFKIAFFGQSGSGKTVAGDLIIQAGAEIGLNTTRLDVATPLHDIQAFSYAQLGLANTGQDQELLRFLAARFEPRLPIVFDLRFRQVLATLSTPLLIVNSDVRNNSYACLKSLGFIFIQVLAAPRPRIGDITPADTTTRVEQTNKIVPDKFLDNYADLSALKHNVDVLLTDLLK